MTLTQELAQALRDLAYGMDQRVAALDELAKAGHLAPVKNWSEKLVNRISDTARANREAMKAARAALARYDAEPPTSRGSEGEVVGWQYFDEGEWHHTHEHLLDHLRKRGMKVRALYAAPPPSQPSAEAWRQATAEAKTWEFEDSIAVCDWIETRARELHAASCAGVESANSSQSEEPRT